MCFAGEDLCMLQGHGTSWLTESTWEVTAGVPSPAANAHAGYFLQQLLVSQSGFGRIIRKRLVVVIVVVAVFG